VGSVVFETICQNPDRGISFELRIMPRLTGALAGAISCPRCRRPGGSLKSCGRLAPGVFAAKLVFKPQRSADRCRGSISDKVDLGLVEEFNNVSSFACKPVKVTMTGPHLLASVAYDEYYHDIGRMMTDLGKLIHHNLKLLAVAGCKHIQIDEPYFTVADDKEVQTAVDIINMAIEGLPDDIHVLVHVCQGNYAVGADYDGQIGHRYFDVGRYKADLICRIDCDAYLIEHDMTRHYEGLLGNRQLGVGAVDVQSPNVETGEQVADRIRTYRWLAAEQTIITSSCGFNHLPRHIVLGKLRAMTEAKAILGGRAK
jgi:5-methyltetrahydropteroyltriglutamate--homocysteine methyltransferase